ncbi:MAG: hypothetical protein HQ503_06950 [Rhodospirillales bacterium]|nr:hypothetical protein [Rhodospirillales bacterium]
MNNKMRNDRFKPGKMIEQENLALFDQAVVYMYHNVKAETILDRIERADDQVIITFIDGKIAFIGHGFAAPCTPP